MTIYNKDFGKRGEDIANQYLINNDYHILSRNFRSKFGEIDIIAEKNGTIYFIEVKTRSNLNKGMPYEAIDYRKNHQLHKTALYFLLNNDYKKYKYSIGVISIILEDQGNYDITFYPSID